MIRVACIGDSITWGFTLLNPWRQSYPALLQEKLGPEYAVRNFGYNDAAARFDPTTPNPATGILRSSAAITAASSNPIGRSRPRRASS